MSNTNKINIDKNIPILPSQRGSMKYPYKEMKVGDSFFVKGKKLNQLSSTVYQNAKRNAPGKKFAMRNVKDGVRVWRIK